MEADPEVRRWVGGYPRSREAAEEKFRRVYLKPRPNRLGMWATVFKPDGRYIGYCGIYGEGTLGYYLAREYWGRGLATEAARETKAELLEDVLGRVVSGFDRCDDARQAELTEAEIDERVDRLSTCSATRAVASTAEVLLVTP